MMITVEWRGRPVWIIHRTKEMIDALPKAVGAPPSARCEARSRPAPRGEPLSFGVLQRRIGHRSPATTAVYLAAGEDVEIAVVVEIAREHADGPQRAERETRDGLIAENHLPQLRHAQLKIMQVERAIDDELPRCAERGECVARDLPPRGFEHDVQRAAVQALRQLFRPIRLKIIDRRICPQR